MWKLELEIKNAFLFQIFQNYGLKHCNLMIMSFMIYQNQNKLSWQQCNLIIRKQHQDSRIRGYFQSLCPQIIFQLENSQQYFFKATISIQQRLLYDICLGFFWHKSHYLPRIDVEIPQFTRNLIINANQKENYEVEIMAGYPVKENQTYFLQQVELIGKTKYEFSNQTSEFTIQNVKFNETSFFHNKNKFSLILAFFVKETQKGQNRILISYISSPISVDSRKNATVKKLKSEYLLQKINHYQFEKKIALNVGNSISQTKSQPQVLHNYGSFDHFIKYYSFSKIRGKYRHPFYIGYHFNQAFQIFYNKEQCSNEINALIMIQNHKKQVNCKILLFYIKFTDSLNKNYTQGQNEILFENNNIKLQQQEMQFIQQDYKGKIEKQNKKKQNFVVVQNLRKRLIKNLFMSWEYFFIQIVTQEQTPIDKLHQKWTLIKKKNLKSKYIKYIKIKENSNIKIEDKQVFYDSKPVADIFHRQVFNLTRSSKRMNQNKGVSDQEQKKQEHKAIQKRKK